MSEASIEPTQLRRRAFIYVRQSSQTQVRPNRESTRRQYELADRARSLGWSPDQVEIIDEDLVRSGASSAERTGFARLTAEVALGQAGIVLGLEVSRLARDNADWCRLLDLCGLTDTLIGDADIIYHPRRHNDRLVLGVFCRVRQQDAQARHRLGQAETVTSKSVVGNSVQRAPASFRSRPIEAETRHFGHD